MAAQLNSSPFVAGAIPQTWIDGLPEGEGAALLDELNRHATQPEFVYTHRWQIGDLVMWDNGFLLHRRDPFDPRQNRLLKRTTIRLSPERHIVPATVTPISA